MNNQQDTIMHFSAPVNKELCGFICKTIGPIYDIKKSQDGMVHDVYKIFSYKTYYLKIRGNCFSLIPSLNIDPEDIKYEKKALEIFSKLLPDIFPLVIGFNERVSAIIMTDINPEGLNLKEIFESGTADTAIMRNIGEALGRTHFALKNISESIRPDGDEQQYKINFDYRLLRFEYPVLSQLVEELKKMPRQLILSDLSPKNIGVSKDEKISSFDLDYAHRGNTIFDLGFLLGHIILHSKNDSDILVKSILLGYKKFMKEPINNKMLEKIIGATMLYRLKNEIIPYSLPVTTTEKKELINKAYNLLGLIN
jgi:5-methylthioribose kinase